MLVKNFKAIVDAFDKSADELKNAGSEAIKLTRGGSDPEAKFIEGVNAEFRRLRGFVLDAVVADENENGAKK